MENRHTRHTLAGVNRRSSQVQVNGAIEDYLISVMKEFKATGFVENWRARTFEEARHIASGLGIEEARKRCGSAKVPNWVWDERYIPQAYRDIKQFPFHMMDDILFKRQLEKAKEAASWQLPSSQEIVEKGEKEIAEEEEGAGEVAFSSDPEIAELERTMAEFEGKVTKEGNEGQTEPGSSDIKIVDPGKNEDGTMTPSEKIAQGLKDRRRYGEPPPEDRREAGERLRAEKSQEDLTPADNIKQGLSERDAQRSWEHKNTRTTRKPDSDE